MSNTSHGNVPEIGIGIIGFGFIGKVHAFGYQNQPLFYDPPPARPRLVGVCTSREETARTARETGGFEFGTTRFEDLLERDDIHAISVATPNDLHRDQVIAALEAGKHVYCDKPLAVSLDEAREMIAVADAHRELLTGMAFQMRFCPATMRARQLIADGFLGRVYHFRASYLHAGYADPKRPMSWRLGPDGGCLADLGSHAIDLMRFLLGEYASVRGTLQRWIDERPKEAGSDEMVPVEVDDYCCLQARMASGALGFIEASRFATGTQDDAGFEIYGEKGALRWSMMDPNYLDAWDEGASGERKGFTRIATVQQYPAPSALPSPKLPVGWMRFHLHAVHDFLSAIASGEPGAATLHDGAATQAVDEAVRLSDASGAWEDVPAV
ncbi:MAG: Gfo/Idh/MocA family protein [Armatimonadota bacterium]|jgi:predicted dehydrogenase